MSDQSALISRAATDIALMELIRLVYSEAFFTPNADEFRKKMEALESAAVNGISSRVPFPNQPKEVNNRVKEEASMLVTKLLTSIHHPDSASGVSS